MNSNRKRGDVLVERQASVSVQVVRRGVMHMARRLRTERVLGSLSSNKLSVLGTLSRLGPLPAGAVAVVERQRPQSLSRIFAELALEGLITRERSETDRREHILSITDAGRAALAADLAQRDAWLAEAMKKLSPTERGVLELAAGIMERMAMGEAALEPVDEQLRRSDGVVA
ncbi:MarR family winged helix-turn-helix transcriptional regulator [Humibacter ginsengisoli]